MGDRKRHYVYTLAYPESMGGTVFYVGKGQGNRIIEHEQRLKNGKGKNTRKNNTIKRIWANGEQVVRTVVSYFDTHEEALQYEIALIFLMRPYGHLTNLTDGGEGAIGRTISEMHRHRLRLANVGKKRSEVAIINIGKAQEGKVLSEETRRKIGEARKGKTWDEKTKIKIGKSNKLHWQRKAGSKATQPPLWEQLA